MSSKVQGRYRVIAVSLHDQEANAADRITEILRQAGWPKANRSLVVREALLRLEDELSDKSGEEIFRYFVDRYARRAGQLPYGEKGNGLGKPTK